MQVVMSHSFAVHYTGKKNKEEGLQLMFSAWFIIPGRATSQSSSPLLEPDTSALVLLQKWHSSTLQIRQIPLTLYRKKWLCPIYSSASEPWELRISNRTMASSDMISFQSEAGCFSFPPLQSLSPQFPYAIPLRGCLSGTSELSHPGLVKIPVGFKKLKKSVSMYNVWLSLFRRLFLPFFFCPPLQDLAVCEAFL